MRISTLAGLVLLFVGIVIIAQDGRLTTRRDVLEVGGLKVTATESHPVAPWLAGAALVAGVSLIVVGLRTGGTRSRF